MGAYFGVANLDRKYGFGVFGGRQVALGFLHKKCQGARLRFSHRPLMHQNCKFNFSDQVKNNMFWVLGSGTAQLTGFDGLWFRHKKRMHLANFHHQIHRHYFEVNHGTLDVP
jgi:hypothetical protein